MTLVVLKKLFGSNGSGFDSGSEKLKYFGYGSVPKNVEPPGSSKKR